MRTKPRQNAALAVVPTHLMMDGSTPSLGPVTTTTHLVQDNNNNMRGGGVDPQMAPGGVPPHAPSLQPSAGAA
jgi:hypothetical protein